MKISLKQQATERKNSEVCVVTKHDIEDATLDFAIVKINGRYPDQGRVTNTQCKEIVYVHQGNGKVVVNHKEYQLNTGDAVLIEAGEKFFWEGSMNLFISCTPAFTIDQHQQVD